jgi:hypothetical protein
VGVVQEPIADGVGQGRLGQVVVPEGGVELTGDNRGASAVAVFQSASNLPSQQHTAFTVFDEIVTSLLLAGGSDGIHQVVTTITTFLDKSKEKAKQA